MLILVGHVLLCVVNPRSSILDPRRSMSVAVFFCPASLFIASGPIATRPSICICGLSQQFSYDPIHIARGASICHATPSIAVRRAESIVRFVKPNHDTCGHTSIVDTVAIRLHASCRSPARVFHFSCPLQLRDMQVSFPSYSGQLQIACVGIPMLALFHLHLQVQNQQPNHRVYRSQCQPPA